MTKAKATQQDPPDETAKQADARERREDEAEQASPDLNEAAAAQAADHVHDDSPEEMPAAPAPAPPAPDPIQAAAPPPPPPEPQKQKSVEQLAVERLRRNGYSEDVIDEALETYGPRAIMYRTHRLESGDVGETGKHGDLGDNALLD